VAVGSSLSLSVWGRACAARPPHTTHALESLLRWVGGLLAVYNAHRHILILCPDLQAPTEDIRSAYRRLARVRPKDAVLCGHSVQKGAEMLTTLLVLYAAMASRPAQGR